MKTSRWQFRLAASLLIVAVMLYAVRLSLFPDPAMHNEMWRFLVGDFAFLFVQVPIVSLVIDGLIRRREREETRRKLNMVIGAFFSETGQMLLGEIAEADSALGQARAQLVPDASWNPADYDRACGAFEAHVPQIEHDADRLTRLRDALEAERPFVIGLLANQTLLEHESFSDLLWALTHLGEELSARGDLAQLEPSDATHLVGDIKRAYMLLGVQWLSYLQHLQHAYPFLFSLAVRTNPLDTAASAEVDG